MLATSFILSAIAAGQAFALPALQERQAVSSASSAIASATSAASSVASVASSSAASAVSSASSSVVSASSASSASASAPSASASNSYASGLLAAISARNAPALASLIAGSPQISQAVVSALSQTTQNFTLLAPSDAGLAAATANIDTSNTTLVTQLLTYHVLPGYYPAAYFGVNQTTILNTAANQNLVFYRNQYLTTNVVGGQNATVLANSTYQNVLIKLIDNALQLPANVSTTLGRTSSGTTLLQTIASTAPQLVNTVDTASAITVFAPSNQAFSNIQSAVNQLAGNPTQLQNVILGHVVAGQTLYSNAGPNNLAGNPTGIMSAANTTFTFATNATGTYVTSQGTTARVIQSNIITSNGLSKPGVIHVIDAVLVPAQAASSSASGAAAAPSSASASASAASSSASGAVSSASSAASSAASAASSAVASATSSA